LIRTALATLLFFGVSLGAEVPRPAPEFVIHLNPSGQILLSQLKGKPVLLALVSTTCPHCQALTSVLNRIYGEYHPKGLEVVSAAFNDMSHMLVPGFIKTYKPAYPLGSSPREPVIAFLQHSAIMQLYVPIVVLIDKHGVIQEQHLGDDEYWRTQEPSIRASVEKLMKAAPVVHSTRKKASGGKK
jgi:thiol-disulfide isomerase/thioredoxin